MSLIDDALKRAQAAGDAAAGRPAERPWIPTPMPDAGLARRRAAIRWIGIAAVAIVVLGAGIALLRGAWTSGSRLPAEKAPAEPRPAVLASTPTLAPEAVVVVTTPFPAARFRPTRAPRPVEVAADAVSEPSEARPTAPARPAASIVNGRTYAGALTLPGGERIELGGIVWSETEPRALLNDRILGVGSFVEGFHVAKIDEDRVELEKDGVTISITVK